MWRAERGALNCAPSSGPPGVTQAVQGEKRRVPLERRRALMYLSVDIGAQPNTRLKLTAPSCWGGHLFVESSMSRRSLSAFR